MNHVTLDSIIKNYLIERGDNTKHGYQRYLQLAINGLQDMNYDVSGQLEYMDVELDNSMSIPIPPDTVNIVSVMFRLKNELIVSANDSSLNMSTSYKCGKAVAPTNENANDVQGYFDQRYRFTEREITKHWRNGEPTGAFFNEHGGNPYRFKVNHQMGVVELSSNHPRNVILSYLPTEKTINGAHLVHPFLKEPLIAWLNYADRRSKNVSKALINDYKHTYVQVKEHARKRFNAFTKEDFLNAVRKGYSAAPKF